MPVLYGREAELSALSGALDSAARGGVELVLVRGEAGIGKTRLLSALRERAVALRFVVLEGRAGELERDVPLVPVLDALGPSERVQLGTERWRVHRELASRLASIAGGRPLLLIVADVQWADPATLEFLEHLVRRPQTGSLLIALGLRPCDAGDRLAAARRASGLVGLRVLELAGLAREAAEGLLGSVAETERARLFTASGG